MKELMLKRSSHLGIVALFALGGCAPEPLGAPEVWFVSTLGQVTTADGAPVTDATVRATWFSAECGGELIDEGEARPDAGGRYSIFLKGTSLEGCVALTVTPDAGSGLAGARVETTPGAQVNVEFGSTLTLDVVLASSTAGVSGQGAP